MSTSDSFGRITDESLADLRSWIGVERRVRGWNSEASADAIRHFAQGVGDDNPLWFDPDYGSRTTEGRQWAPESFLYSCDNGGLRVGEDGVFPAEDWLPGTLPIWVSDRWVFHRRLYAGERLHATASLHSVEEKPGRGGVGRMVVHVDRVAFTADDGAMIAECFKTLNRYERPDPTAAPPEEASAAGAAEKAEIPGPTYTVEEIESFDAHYDLEATRRRGAEPLFGDDVEVGDELPELVKGPLTVTGIVGFVLGWGSPVCQTNRIVSRYLRAHPMGRLVNPATNIYDTVESPHWELYHAVHHGMGRRYDFGPQRICWLVHLLTDWMGDTGRVTALEVRLRRPNFVGDVTWARGTISAKHCVTEGWLVDLALRADEVQPVENVLRAGASASQRRRTTFSMTILTSTLCMLRPTAMDLILPNCC